MARPGSGNAGEAMVLAAMVRRGLSVLVPFGEGLPYDLAVDLGTRALLRVQCKTAWPVGGCLIFNCLATDHGRGPRSYLGRADIFGVYFPPTRAVYLVPIAGVAESEGRLRLKPTRNNQKRGIRFAADFEIERWTLDSLREVVRPPEARDEAALGVA